MEWKGVFFPVCLGGYFVQNLKGRIFARGAAEGCNLLQIIRSTYIFRGKESFRSEDGENRRPEPLPPPGSPVLKMRTRVSPKCRIGFEDSPPKAAIGAVPHEGF